MFGVVFKLFGAAVALIIIVYMAANTFRKARRLDARIAEFKAEQEDLKRRGVPINPYAELADLYAEEKRPPRKSKSEARKSSR